VQVRIKQEDIIKNVQDRIKQDVHLKTEIIFKFLEKGATTQTLSEKQKEALFKNGKYTKDSIENFLTSNLFSQAVLKKSNDKKHYISP